MFWLALGGALLLWAAISNQNKPRFDLLGAAAVACFCGGIFWSLSAYPRGAVAMVCIFASLAGAGLAFTFPFARLAVRLTAICSGAVALLFALLGPAEGLF